MMSGGHGWVVQLRAISFYGSPCSVLEREAFAFRLTFLAAGSPENTGYWFLDFYCPFVQARKKTPRASVLTKSQARKRMHCATPFVAALSTRAARSLKIDDPIEKGSQVDGESSLGDHPASRATSGSRGISLCPRHGMWR